MVTGPPRWVLAEDDEGEDRPRGVIELFNYAQRNDKCHTPADESFNDTELRSIVSEPTPTQQATRR